MKTTSKGHLRSQSHKGAGSRSCGLLSVVLNYFRSSNKVRTMGDSDVAALVGQPALLQLVQKVGSSITSVLMGNLSIYDLVNILGY